MEVRETKQNDFDNNLIIIYDSGSILLLSSGLHIAWGIWTIFRLSPWVIKSQPTNGIIIFTMMSWYFGAFFGNFVGAIIVRLLRKSMIYVSANMKFFWKNPFNKSKPNILFRNKYRFYNYRLDKMVLPKKINKKN